MGEFRYGRSSSWSKLGLGGFHLGEGRFGRKSVWAKSDKLGEFRVGRVSFGRITPMPSQTQHIVGTTAYSDFIGIIFV